MPRRAKIADPPAAPPAIALRADGIYPMALVRAALALGAGALRREWRAGRLRILRRCNRNFILGRDLIAWLDGGELPSPANRNGAPPA